MSRSAAKEPLLPTTPLTRKALRDSVYDRILEMLLDGTFAPDRSLSIDALARQLMVSPTPVREALVHLERTGLVSRHALRGYRVAPPLNAHQIHDLCEARLILEVGALDTALWRLEGLSTELQDAHEHHMRTAERLMQIPRDHRQLSDFRPYFEADWSFHWILMQHAHNDYLLQMAESLGSHVHRLRQSVASGLTDASLALAEHGEVLAAVQRGDLEGTREALRQHLQEVERRSTADIGMT